MTAMEADIILGRVHRHVSSEARRARVRHVAGDVWLVLAACRCGARRRELVRYSGPGRAGRLVQAGPWEAPK